MAEAESKTIEVEPRVVVEIDAQSENRAMPAPARKQRQEVANIEPPQPVTERSEERRVGKEC